MRATLKALLEKLGVDRELSPYETQPWFYYDENKGISCSAEVRMGPGNADLEAEIQFLYDERDEDSGSAGETGGNAIVRPASGHEQVMRMRALPVSSAEWSPKAFVVRGEDYTTKLGGWEEKSCEFFRSCIAALQMSELPDIEDIIEKELADESAGGGRRGRVGRKSPKVKPGALLGMKKPGS